MQEQVGMIAAIKPGSLAEQLGIRPGGVLLSMNGQEISDIVDFRLGLANEQLEVTWRDAAGGVHTKAVTKQFGEDLGIVFSSPTIDSLKVCRNNCQFCFVRQQPAGLRSSLVVRDDDYRLSALQGSFITLTNLAEREWRRILEMRLSPLYISVHTTNGPLRAELLSNPKAANIMQQLKELAERQIEVHCQIVLVPGVNDGPELHRTVNDLAAFWPTVQSVAVVPVGLTEHREQLPPLRTPGPAEARQVIDYLLPLSRKFHKQFGVSFAYIADEWFVLAGSAVPPRSYYDDFPQVENGVGLTRIFLDQAARAMRNASRRLRSARKVVWVTGYSAATTLSRLAMRLNRIEGLWIDVLPIRNRVFGETVTVAGLVCGRDILAQLRQVECAGATVLIPDVMLRPDEQDFLDDFTWSELVQAFPDARLILTPTDGRSLVKYTLGEEAN